MDNQEKQVTKQEDMEMINQEEIQSGNQVENLSKKPGRGGKRPGAGRPKGDGSSKLYAFRADKEVAAYLDSRENKTDFIKECIVRQMEAGRKQQEEEALMQWGEVMPTSRIKPMTLPFFDVKVVAGFPIPLNNDELAQDIEVLKMLCPHPDSSYLIRVQGRSMIEAGVNDGDIIIVDKSERNPTEKQIAVCELNGEYTLKRVCRKGGTLWLVPANPEYPEIEITEGDDFSVWGVVTYIIHKPVY